MRTLALCFVALAIAADNEASCYECSCSKPRDMVMCAACLPSALATCVQIEANSVVVGDYVISSVEFEPHCVIFNDNVTVTGSVLGSAHADCVVVVRSTIEGSIALASGDDCLVVEASTVGRNVSAGDIDAGTGSDRALFVDSYVAGSYIGGAGTKDIVVARSSAFGGSMEGNAGVDCFDVCATSLGGGTVSGDGEDDCLSVSRLPPQAAAIAINGANGLNNRCRHTQGAPNVSTLDCQLVEYCPASPARRRKRSAPAECVADFAAAFVIDHSLDTAAVYEDVRDAVVHAVGDVSPLGALAISAAATSVANVSELSTNTSELSALAAAMTRTSPNVGIDRNLELALTNARALLGDAAPRRAIFLFTVGWPTMCASSSECDAPLENCANATACFAAQAAAAAAADAIRGDGTSILTLFIDLDTDADASYYESSISTTTVSANATQLVDALDTLIAAWCASTLEPSPAPTRIIDAIAIDAEHHDASIASVAHAGARANSRAEC